MHFPAEVLSSFARVTRLGRWARNYALLPKMLTVLYFLAFAIFMLRHFADFIV
jgi:hypothetical protein